MERVFITHYGEFKIRPKVSPDGFRYEREIHEFAQQAYEAGNDFKHISVNRGFAVRHRIHEMLEAAR